MNKRAIFILGLIVLFFGTAYAVTKMGNKGEDNIVADEVAIVKEEESVPLNQETVSTSIEEVKATPNTILILKKLYTDCGHTITDTAEIPDEMVNLTEKELAEKYSSWTMEKFSKEEIILSKELDSFCGEHYLLIEEEGKVQVYILDESGNRNLKETTEIAFEYLPETDKVILQNRDLCLWK